MPARQFSDEERENILALAEREGDKRACATCDLPESTLRSWRHRAQRAAERKVIDRRARDKDTEAVGASTRTVDVTIPTDEWDPAMGGYKKVPAKAKIIPVGKFELGRQLVSQGAKRELCVSPELAGDLAMGDVVLLGGEHLAEFSDALWRIVPAGQSNPGIGVPPFYEIEPPTRSDPVFTVEPARAPKQAPAPPAGSKSWDDYERERMRNLNEQMDEMRRRELELDELRESWARR